MSQKDISSSLRAKRAFYKARVNRLGPDSSPAVLRYIQNYGDSVVAMAAPFCAEEFAIRVGVAIQDLSHAANLASSKAVRGLNIAACLAGRNDRYTEHTAGQPDVMSVALH